MPKLPTFGNAIAVARHKNNLTQAELAALVKLSRVSIANIETDKQFKGGPNVRTLILFAKALQINPIKLVKIAIKEWDDKLDFKTSEKIRKLQRRREQIRKEQERITKQMDKLV